MKKLLLAVAVLLVGVSAFAQDVANKGELKKPPLILAQLTDPQIGFMDWDDELERFRQEIAFLNKSDCQAVVICGDMMHFTHRKNMELFQQELSRLKRPVFLVPGNHDIAQVPDSRAQWLEMFGPAYYAADLPGGNYRLVVVDTELWQHPTDETAQMDAMFLEELEKARESGKRIVLAAHAAIFIESPDEAENYSNLPKERREWLLGHLAGSPVVAYLSGHTHTSFSFMWKGILFSSGDNTSVTFDCLGHGFRRIVFDGEWVRFRTIPIEKLPSVTIPLLTSEPRIDGILDEELWKKATEVVLLRHDGTQPPENDRATLRVGWTKDAFVIGAVCRSPRALESSSAIGAHDDSNIFKADDLLEFYFGDREWSSYRRLAVDFEGHFWDSSSAIKQADGWNPQWKFAINRTDEFSWTPEIVIPFKELWDEPAEINLGGDFAWRVNFCRLHRKGGWERQSWSPPSFFFIPSVFGSLVFPAGGD